MFVPISAGIFDHSESGVQPSAEWIKASLSLLIGGGITAQLVTY